MHTKKEILPAVAAVIFNKKGEVLLQRRKDVNQWGIISGHVEFGEGIREAILREILEETNVNARIVRFIGVYSSPESQTYYYPKRTVQYVTSYFEAELMGDIEVGYSNSETQEIRFFPLDHIPAELALINSFWLSDALNKNALAFIR